MTSGVPGAPDVAAEKRDIRTRIRDIRDAIPGTVRDTHAATITERLLTRLAAARPKVVASYVSFGSEFDTSAFNASVQSRGVALVLPRVDRGNRRLDLYLVVDVSRDLVPGVWGILEPDPRRCIAVDVGVVDWCLVPGAAFDRQGGRLGYGAGFYDRLLTRSRCARVAAAFHAQLIDRVPVEPHDQRVDVIVTEQVEVLVRSS
ncbi:MAG: 5-formyltetrahydrofolate cyclo-ligase [Burkholderiales bacterium]